MNNTGYLKGKTVFITGGSRGIGFAIAKKLAADGANIAIAARSVELKQDPNAIENETIFTAAKKIEEAGGRCLPCQVDVRNEQQIQSALEKTAQTFGGIDIVINNCSYLNLTNVGNTDIQKYDEMFRIITRGAYLVCKLSYPYLKKSNHAHILNISPPINLDPVWLELHAAYTAFKFSVSMYTIGMSKEFKKDNIAVNSLWPKKVIYSSGMIEHRGPKARKFCRSVDIMADAAYAILIKDPKVFSGNLNLDEDVLKNENIHDMGQYSEAGAIEEKILPDVFVGEVPNFDVINE
ncbi:hydroxysteroid dehydrogenase-like protein 2 [Planococcus citri]|uniref:hydroxysteroid dehydrogenase-like protein 2 n=1 Tax=Planococcus citri TaxID=170843 RepID=UPI0031F91196